MFRLTCLLIGWIPLMTTTHAQDAKQFIYFGTYTGKGSEGIYLAELDSKLGTLSTPKLAANVVNPSFLALHPTKRYLYAVSEVETTDGKKGGGVTAFARDPDTGLLTKLNSQLTGGGAPCHICVDKTGQCVLVANYSGGSVTSLPIHADGSVGEAVSLIKHTGSSVNKQRQEAAHAHSINVDPTNKFAVVADLGTDEIRLYDLDPANAQLKPHGIVKTPAGGGPRHLAFHPQGPFAYTNNEMTSSVTCLGYDAKKGNFQVLNTLSTLPEKSTVDNSTAEIRVHPSGKFLYVSNRGHNSIAIFQIKDDGSLLAQGHVSTQGKTPRNFGINNDFLIAANQDSGNVVVFRIDQSHGGLTPTGSSVQVSMPVCVVFVP